MFYLANIFVSVQYANMQCVSERRKYFYKRLVDGILYIYQELE